MTPPFTPEDYERESAEGFDAFGPDFTRTSDLLLHAASTLRRVAQMEQERDYYRKLYEGLVEVRMTHPEYRAEAAEQTLARVQQWGEYRFQAVTEGDGGFQAAQREVRALLRGEAP